MNPRFLEVLPMTALIHWFLLLPIAVVTFALVWRSLIKAPSTSPIGLADNPEDVNDCEDIVSFLKWLRKKEA